MSSVSFSVEVNREEFGLAVMLDYAVDGYNDPETGEYFGDTSWSVHVTDLDSGATGSMGNYASESDSIWIDLGVAPDGGLQRQAIDFLAFNTFSGDDIALDLTVLAAVNARDALAIDGTAGSDVIVGGFGADSLAGGAGGDLLDAGPGDDVLAGGDGADQLAGGAGADTLSGNAGDDVYRLDDRRDAVLEAAGEGRDTVLASVTVTLADNVEVLRQTGNGAIAGNGNALANLLVGNFGANRLSGAGGADSLQGSEGQDTLEGGSGNDTLDGGGGLDSLAGGGGNDTYLLVTALDAVSEAEGEGIDTVIGINVTEYTLGAGIENFIVRALYVGSLTPAADVDGNAADNLLSGGGAADTLHGAAGADSLLGGEGTDLLFGGAGADVLRGGGGRDVASYVDAAAGVGVDLRAGAGYAGEADGDLLREIENLAGSGWADTLAGSAAGNVLWGDAGDDSLDGGGGDDTLFGGDGADTLAGGAGRDLVTYAGIGAAALSIDLAAASSTGAGGDLLVGIESLIADGGADTLLGSAADNLLGGGGGDDSLAGGAGDDTIAGGSGADLLDGGAGSADVLSYAGSADAIVVQLATQEVAGGDAQGDLVTGFEGAIGGRGDDTLAGTDGSDRLWGGGGGDRIDAGAGDDQVDGGAGGDTLNGGEGIDTLSYAGSHATVVVYLADGTVYYGQGQGDVIEGFENLVGGNAGDYLVGDDGANRLSGAGGNDALDGGAGDDLLAGGAGGDSFIFRTGSGHDTVRGFSVADAIVPDLGPAFDSFEELMAVAHVAGPNGEHTVFDFGAAGTLTVLNVALDAFGPDNFLF